MAAMQKAWSLHTGDPVKAQDAKKDAKKKVWIASAGIPTCKDCSKSKGEALSGAEPRHPV